MDEGAAGVCVDDDVARVRQAQRLEDGLSGGRIATEVGSRVFNGGAGMSGHCVGGALGRRRGATTAPCAHKRARLGLPEPVAAAADEGLPVRPDGGLPRPRDKAAVAGEERGVEGVELEHVDGVKEARVAGLLSGEEGGIRGKGGGGWQEPG